MANVEGEDGIYAAPLRKDVIIAEGSSCTSRTLGTCNYTRVMDIDDGRGRKTVKVNAAYIGTKGEIVLEDIEIEERMRGEPTKISNASFRNGNLLTYNEADACELSLEQKQAARALKQATHVALELTKIPYLNMPDTGKDPLSYTSGLEGKAAEFCRPGRVAIAP